MLTNLSLRFRMMLFILCPLLLIAILAVSWRFIEAQQTAENIFDRTLIALALAISRDVAISGGDSLSIATRDLMSQVSGGHVFYHVKGPDGSYVTGYAYPPRVENAANEALKVFDTQHQNQNVRAVLLTENVQVNGVEGLSTTIVWQQEHLHAQLAIKLALRAAMLTAALMLSVAILVFFGVRYGLRPLNELEDAISKRSSHDLTTIRRKIPLETQGIVNRLNTLFDQLRSSFDARDRLISNAAHQLRNPIAAIQSMADAAKTAPTIADMRDRVNAISVATVRVSRLTSQMLSLEKLQSENSVARLKKADLVETVSKQCLISAQPVLANSIEFVLNTPPQAISVFHDEMLISEAIENLINNAMEHGGSSLTEISVKVFQDGDQSVIQVINDGEPILPEHKAQIFERFSQREGSSGSGLGLSIVAEIIRLHKGGCRLIDSDNSTGFELRF
jgi:two-component system sensor histidine kinase TctE